MRSKQSYILFSVFLFCLALSNQILATMARDIDDQDHDQLPAISLKPKYHEISSQEALLTQRVNTLEKIDGSKKKLSRTVSVKIKSSTKEKLALNAPAKFWQPSDILMLPTVYGSGPSSICIGGGNDVPTFCPGDTVLSTLCPEPDGLTATECPGNQTLPTHCPNGHIEPTVCYGTNQTWSTECAEPDGLTPTTCPNGEQHSTNCEDPDPGKLPTHCPEGEHTTVCPEGTTGFTLCSEGHIPTWCYYDEEEGDYQLWATHCRKLFDVDTTAPTTCPDGEVIATHCTFPDEMTAPTECDFGLEHAPTNCSDGQMIPTTCPDGIVPTQCTAEKGGGIIVFTFCPEGPVGCD